ncbi:protein kinase domain-containing protein [Aliinostoc sp. HNIBRCY26]|uniref:protein kinase domain-containing protein n=1 Tax=Aliinostoc sp. HNIBRCY26 TaxID=3418997 RepID=UPI003D02D1FB
MEVYCTRPNCPRPQNYFPDLDDTTKLKTAQQIYCVSCGMPLMLDGRYVPKKLLGKGGFGSAFLAGDRRIPGMRPCVVKQFQPAGNLTPQQLEIAAKLFEREAEVLAEIGREHEQITELYAFFPMIVPSWQGASEDQFFYLVQEYIDGQTLEAELAQSGQFSEDKALEILQEILKILQFIHYKNIIHRDIKPSNIMRRQDGKLFLLDFGAVKQVTNVSGVVNGTSTGIYTLGFAAPEQMAGNQVFPATDLYALAATVLNLLTNQEITKLFDSYMNRWIWREKVNISTHLADILDKMLLPAVHERFQSANEVLTAISPSPTQRKISPQAPPKANFSTWELLVGAAFSGFEGGLMAIALFSFTQSPILTLVVAAIILGLLIFAQTKRWIEKFDLLIIAIISLTIVFFIPGIIRERLVVLSVAAALVAISATALFRLIYKLLSRII